MVSWTHPEKAVSRLNSDALVTQLPSSSPINIMLSVSWYLIPHNSTMLLYLSSLALFSLWISYAIGVDSKLLSSRPMKFLSGISMEMYLAQMIIFRVIEKIHLLYIFGRSGIRGWISLFVTFFLTVVGLICFIECYKKRNRIYSNKNW